MQQALLLLLHDGYSTARNQPNEITCFFQLRLAVIQRLFTSPTILSERSIKKCQVKKENDEIKPSKALKTPRHDISIEITKAET